MNIRKVHQLSLALILLVSITVVKAQSTCPAGGADVATTYSLYKEYFKQNNYEKALPYWRIIYKEAPGFKKQAFFDGQVMFTSLIQNTQDAALREKYIDTLMAIYDKRIECWGDKDYVLTNKAIDTWKYRPGNLVDVKNIFQEALQAGGNNAKYYALSNYFRVLLELKDKPGGVTTDFIKEEYPKLINICDVNIAKADKEAENFKATKADLQSLYKNEILPKRFQEGGIWYSGINALQKADSILKWLNEDSTLQNLNEMYYYVRRDAEVKDSLIKIQLETKIFEISPSADKANDLGAHYYNKQDFVTAEKYFKKSYELATKNEDKIRVSISLADTYRQMKKFPEARDAAKAAIALDSTVAKAYYLIGILYMSSGELCGPGTGFESQKVLWPAFDYLEKAKTLDPSLAEVINPLLTEYKQFLPDRATIAGKGLKVGGTYFVNCWIQENGTVRAKN